VTVVRKGLKKNFQVKIEELNEEMAPLAASEAEQNLGMTVKEITPELAQNFGLSETTGLVVVQVDTNTPAEEAGMQPGDIILEIDQVPVKGLSQFTRKIESYKKGDTILFLVKRRDTTIYLTLKIRQ
jgi:serine protease Do